MEFTIYSIGDSEFLIQVLNALAMITAVDSFDAMVQVGIAVGVFATFLSAIAKGGKSIEFQHVLLGYILWATMFVPTATVIVEDSYTGRTEPVANVPVGPAAAGGIISLVGYEITRLFETAYTPIVPRVTETEFAESLRLLNSIRNTAASSAIWRGLNEAEGGGFVDLRKSWASYIKDCTLKKIDLAVMTPEELASGRITVALRFNSDLFGTQVWLQSANPVGQTSTCADAWTDLSDATQFNNNDVVESLNALLGFDSNHNLAAGESAFTKTGDALGAMIGAGINAQTYMLAAVLEPVVMQAASGKYDQLNDLAGAAMVNQAIQQRNTSWAAEQTMFMSIVRPMLAFFEAFIYAISPIMAFVIVLGSKGIQLAGKYFLMLLWIQLWMPLLSIVNLYIYTAASRRMDLYSAMDSHNWDSFYALNAAADTMQTWIATGGLLASMTPALALMLIYGSSVTATHLAGRMKGGDYLDEKQSTPSLGNVGPLTGVSGMSQFEAGAGRTRPGDDFLKIGFGDTISRELSSAKAEERGFANQLGTTVSQNVMSGESQTLNQQRARDIREALMAQGGEAYNIVQSTANDFIKNSDYTSAHQEGVEAAVAGALVGNVGVKGGVSGQKLFQQVSTSLASWGVTGKGEGEGQVVQSKEQIQGSAGNKKTLGGSIEGGLEAKGQYTATDKTSDTVSQQAGESLREGLSELKSEVGQAQLYNTMAAGFTKTNAFTEGETWSKTDAESQRQDYAEAANRSEKYSELDKQSQQFGTSINLPINKAAYQTVEAGNRARAQGQQGPDEMLLGKAREIANSGDHSKFATLLDSNTEMYKQRIGASTKDEIRQAEVMAALHTLQNGAAYGDDTQTAAEGAGVVLQALNQTVGNAADTGKLGDPTRNNGVSQGPLGMDPSQQKDLTPELRESREAARNGTIDSSRVQTPSDNAEALVRGAYSGYRDQAASKDTNHLREPGELLAANYNSQYDNGWQPKASTPAMIGGIIDKTSNMNDEGWAKAVDGGSAFINGYSKELGALVNEIEGMSPEAARAFSEDYAANSSGFLKYHESAAGFLANAVSGGKPEGMTDQAYFGALTGAAINAIAGGTEEAGKVIEQAQEAAYDARLQQAVSMGLSTEDGSAQMYAEAFKINMGQELSRIAESLGAPVNSNYGTGEMVDNMNQFKMSLVDVPTDSQGYQLNSDGSRLLDSNGEPNQVWRYENVNGQQAVVLNDDNLNQFADNFANNIYMSTWVGEHGGGFLARGNSIANMLNPDR